MKNKIEYIDFNREKKGHYLKIVLKEEIPAVSYGKKEINKMLNKFYKKVK